MKCPKCGSEHVQFYSTTNTQGPSVSSSCCGYILLGPLGLLCGLCGMGSETKEYWLCQDCGNKFSVDDAQKNMQDEQQKTVMYSQYKEELTSLAEAEGDAETIKARQAAAAQRLETARKQRDQMLEQLAASGDPQVAKLANRARIMWPMIPLLILALAGVVLMSGSVLVGLLVIALAVGLGLWFLYTSSDSENKLKELDGGFKTVKDEMEAAKAEKERCDALMKKVAFVEEYENRHKQS